MTTLFDEETIQKNHIASERRDAREKTRTVMDSSNFPQDLCATLLKLVWGCRKTSTVIRAGEGIVAISFRLFLYRSIQLLQLISR